MAYEGPLFNPMEQLDEVVLWLGRRTRRRPNVSIDIVPDMWALTALICAPDLRHLWWLIGGPEGLSLIIGRGWDNSTMAGRSPDYRPPTWNLHLTWEGLKRYHELQAGRVQSRKVFMAMKFKDPDDLGLEDMYQAFRNALEADTEFVLERLDEHPVPGGISERMVLEIRTSRMMVADLTYGNQNVYWEAGYAEGLHRPVVYTLHADRKSDSTFDTKQRQTVFWTKDTLSEACNVLVATLLNASDSLPRSDRR